jgi:cation diffusion facilitator family transporter
MSADTRHIYQSLFANLAIAVGKAVAAGVSGSGAMLAETLHSFADCGNQVLLLLGVRQAQRPPDAKHPLGYGRTLYFWSFMVALLLFSGGGMFSIYEGVHKLWHPEPVSGGLLSMAVLVGSLALEGGATWSNVKEMRARAKGKPLLKYMRETKDSDLVVVFGENAAATLGLVAALVAVALTAATGSPTWDSIGSIVVGVVLVLVAIFLAIEVKSLLVGEAADAEIDAAVRRLVLDDPDIDDLNSLVTVQQGPGEVLVAMKLRFHGDRRTEEVCDIINRFEARLRERCPEVKWCYVEPGKLGEG